MFDCDRVAISIMFMIGLIFLFIINIKVTEMNNIQKRILKQLGDNQSQITIEK